MEANQVTTVITNNHARDLLSYDELSEDERRDFEYVEGTEFHTQRFFRYKGSVYDTSDCEVPSLPEPWWNKGKWSGYYSETFFSGVVFKWTNSFEQVIVGRYFT